MKKFLPYLILALGLLFVLRALKPDSTDGFDIKGFGSLPVQSGGRIQPIDSLARNSLRVLSGKTTLTTDEGRKLNAAQWLLDLTTRPEVSNNYKVFRIDNAEVLGLFGWQQDDRKYFSWNELIPNFEALREQISAIPQERDRQNAFQRGVSNLATSLTLYNALAHSLNPGGGLDDLPLEYASWQTSVIPGRQAFAQMEANEPYDREVFERFAFFTDRYIKLSQVASIGIAPPEELPHAQADALPNWPNVGEALLGTIQSGQLSQSVQHYAGITKSHRAAWADGNAAQAAHAAHAAQPAHAAHAQHQHATEAAQPQPTGLPYAASKPLQKAADSGAYGSAAAQAPVAKLNKADIAAFNQNIAIQHAYLDAQAPMTRVRFENFFNHFEPFYLSSVLYVMVFVVVCLSWLVCTKPLQKGAWMLLLLAFLIQTFGLLARMYIQERPPVTNLYSSAVFVGWGAVLLGLILERAFKGGVGSFVSSLVGFASLIIAHNLGAGGDTLEMMQAVLDSNFWLATHVVIITAGYSAVFLAGGLGILYVIQGTLTTSLQPTVARSLYRMTYGITCFGLFFSFVGTMLGGIWADQSWGRFWGWDPKENGALLIVLWGALMLHARWGGLVRERGFMLLAIFGNIITAWSWFGTNMLGIGLHSYGFMDKAVFWLEMFWLSQVCIMLLGSLPLSKWRSAI